MGDTKSEDYVVYYDENDGKKWAGGKNLYLLPSKEDAMKILFNLFAEACEYQMPNHNVSISIDSFHYMNDNGLLKLWGVRKNEKKNK